MGAKQSGEQTKPQRLSGVRNKRFDVIYISIQIFASGSRAFAPLFGALVSKTPCFTDVFAIFFGLRGASRARKVVENHAFYRVSRAFRFPSNFDVFSFAFSKKLRKPHVLPRLSGREAAVPRPFFRRFCTLAL